MKKKSLVTTVKKNIIKCRHFETGQIFVLALIVLSLVTITTVSLIAGALTFHQNSKYSTEVIQATNLAEAGIDKATASLNATGGTYNGEGNDPTGIALGAGYYSVTVTSIDAANKLITSTGYIPTKVSPKTKKTISIQISKGDGVSFRYGLQVGEGGIQMGNSNIINGSVYSNGNIQPRDGSPGNSNTITGDVWVAGGTQPAANQQPECSGVNCSDFIFGKNVGGNDQLDVAQSFKPSVTAVLNKISLKLKKHGNPANLTVRILNDNGSGTAPNKNNPITYGTLSADQVGLDTDPYGFTYVTFNSSPLLNADTYYWIMLDTTPNTYNYYWYWSEDTTQGYTCGSTPPCLAKWSPDWQAPTPVWNNIAADLDFKTYMGGVTTSISLGNSSLINGNVHANTINNLIIDKDAYYHSEQSITNSTVRGTSHPNSDDPPPTNFPISDTNIFDWQQAAQSANPTLSAPVCNSVWGPGKFSGDITPGNSCTVIVKSPVWITGNLTMGNSSKFQLDPSYGASSGMLIIDGTITLSNSNNFLGSGTAGSYMMVLTTHDSTQDQSNAIDTGNSSVSGILYAPKGIITLANSTSVKEVTAWKIIMGNTMILTYETGFASAFFTSGPSGSFNVVKGSYQIK